VVAIEAGGAVGQLADAAVLIADGGRVLWTWLRCGIRPELFGLVASSTPGVSPRRRQPATGPPGSYPDRTSTSKRRRAYDQRSTTPSTSSLLGARMIKG